MKKEDLDFIRDKWGQTHEELCTELGYDLEDSDDLIMLDFFWDADAELWLNKIVEDEREQELLDSLRYK